MADVFNALADPTRRGILRLLRGVKLPAGDIAAQFPQQRPAISKHLSILREAGILEETRRRQQRLYSIRPGAFAPVLGLIGELPTMIVPASPVKSFPMLEPPEPPLRIEAPPTEIEPADDQLSPPVRRSDLEMEFD